MDLAAQESSHANLTRKTIGEAALDVPALQLRGACKSYGAVQAVRGIDLRIERGETVALLGPNGAGKSTTIGMLLGLLEPSSGAVTVFGTTAAEAIRRSHVGAMLQDERLMAGAHVGEFLDFVRGLHPAGMSRDQLIHIAGLEGLEARRVDRLSGGQTQRVRFAMAIAGNPDLLVLDEPTAAMDVESRRDFWVRMGAYAELGNTILFATHYLEEAEMFASRLVIMARGQVVADGTVQDIQQRYGEPRITFVSRNGGNLIRFQQLPGVTRAELQGEHVTLHTLDADTTVQGLVRSNLSWKQLQVRTNDLEETFLRLVSDKNKEAAA
jgi:ABC-2 type transport system ATP-binding protein